MKRPSQEKLILDIKGVSYLLTRKNLQKLVDIRDVKGDKWVISDFIAGVPPRVMTVEAPMQYADMLLLRKLQQSGDIAGIPRVITHKKVARGKTSTEVFFSAMREDDFKPYEDRASEDPDQHLLFSINALLYAELSAAPPKKNVLVMYEHDRHVDYVVGRDGKVLGANRISAYSADVSAKEGLAESLKIELRNLEDSLRFKVETIRYFNWMEGQSLGSADTGMLTGDAPSSSSSGFGSGGSQEISSGGWGSVGKDEATGKSSGWDAALQSGVSSVDKAIQNLSSWVMKLASDLQVECVLLPCQWFDLDGGHTIITSVPEAAKRLSDGWCANPPKELYAYRAQRLAPLTVLLSWVLVFSLYIGAQMINQRATNLSALAMGTETPDSVVLDPDHKTVTEFANRLYFLKSAPSLQEIFAEMTKARRENQYFDKVTVEYANNDAVISLQGRITSGFDLASKEHEAFVAQMRNQGYRLMENKLTTDVMQINFSLKFGRSSL
ncbi:MAG: hypothetical protein HQL51_01955 [Magnetococcales bacterium]|nr:hypothetical protein [Magnetococcales bacterium]